MKRFWYSLEFLIGVIPLLIGSILLVFGIFSPAIEHRSWYIPLALGIASTALTFCVLRYEIGKIRNERILGQILEKVTSPIETRIVKLDQVELYYEYLLFRVKTCRESWFDMGGFDPRAKDIPPFASRLSYYEERERLASRIGQFRYLAVLRDLDHVSRVEKLIQTSRNSLSSVRHVEDDTQNLNKIEVTIVDGNEVIIGYYQPDSEMQAYVSIAGAPVVALFQSYYNDLWGLAERGVLKRGGDIKAERLKQLRESLGSVVGLVRAN
jgi:hypothetical protein